MWQMSKLKPPSMLQNKLNDCVDIITVKYSEVLMSLDSTVGSWTFVVRFMYTVNHKKVDVYI